MVSFAQKKDQRFFFFSLLRNSHTSAILNFHHHNMIPWYHLLSRVLKWEFGMREMFQRDGLLCFDGYSLKVYLVSCLHVDVCLQSRGGLHAINLLDSSVGDTLAIKMYDYHKPHVISDIICCVIFPLTLPMSCVPLKRLCDLRKSPDSFRGLGMVERCHPSFVTAPAWVWILTRGFTVTSTSPRFISLSFTEIAFKESCIHHLPPPLPLSAWHPDETKAFANLWWGQAARRDINTR